MRFIPTRIHGIADYIVGLIVIALPFAFAIDGPARAVLVTLGVIAVVYSVFTDYELGAVRILRMRFHLLLDAIFGFAMLLVPILFTVGSAQQWPLYLIGFLALILTFTTKVRAGGTAA